ncbi:uncharacterized protein [Choristoneura fumiferana]|uniref:uncharacterized protein n=1 Tax=Choristoneura fumiferana TaxID=7141 RepID=UPI003D157037
MRSRLTFQYVTAQWFNAIKPYPYFPDYESDYSMPDQNIQSVVSIPVQVTSDGSGGRAKPDLIDPFSQPKPSEDQVHLNDAATSSTGTATATNLPALPADILEALGESKVKDEVFGPPVREEVSKRWGKIIMEGLGKEQKQKLLESQLFPDNFQILKAPKLNPEISTILTESTINRDKRLKYAQNQLGVGIASLTNLMSRLMDTEDINKTEIIKKLSETGQILLDLHYQNTINRRKLIIYCLDKKFLDIVQEVKRDSFLFGENLGEKIKASKSAERSGLQIKRPEPQPSTSYRNNQPAARRGNSTGPLKQNQRTRLSGPRPYRPPQATSRRPAAAADRYTTPSKAHPRPTRKTT